MKLTQHLNAERYFSSLHRRLIRELPTDDQCRIWKTEKLASDEMTDNMRKEKDIVEFANARLNSEKDVLIKRVSDLDKEMEAVKEKVEGDLVRSKDTAKMKEMILEEERDQARKERDNEKRRAQVLEKERDHARKES